MSYVKKYISSDKSNKSLSIVFFEKLCVHNIEKGMSN